MRTNFNDAAIRSGYPATIHDPVCEISCIMGRGIPRGAHGAPYGAQLISISSKNTLSVPPRFGDPSRRIAVSCEI